MPIPIGIPQLPVELLPPLSLELELLLELELELSPDPVLVLSPDPVLVLSPELSVAPDSVESLPEEVSLAVVPELDVPESTLTVSALSVLEASVSEASVSEASALVSLACVADNESLGSMVDAVMFGLDVAPVEVPASSVVLVVSESPGQAGRTTRQAAINDAR
ncbi:MAG: hypothetical protein JKY37_25025 [Nannocystaceae bacterium]|nr:hypothetical protein [Nannocystaceae bacterium]